MPEYVRIARTPACLLLLVVFVPLALAAPRGADKPNIVLVDPKEEVPELNYLNHTWVNFPLYQVLEDHQASIATDPGAPDP